MQKREVVIVSWQLQQSRNHVESENQKSVRRKRHGGTRFSNESVMGGTFSEKKTCGGARFLNRKRVGGTFSLSKHVGGARFLKKIFFFFSHPLPTPFALQPTPFDSTD